MTYLRSIDDPVAGLGGVGPAAAKAYKELGIHTRSDLLLLAPRTWEDRSTVHPLGSVQDGEIANTLVEVLSHSYFGLKKGMKRTLKIIVRDVSGLGDGRLSLLCFGRNFLEKTIRVGRIYYLWAGHDQGFGEAGYNRPPTTAIFHVREDSSSSSSSGSLSSGKYPEGSCRHRRSSTTARSLMKGGSLSTMSDPPPDLRQAYRRTLASPVFYLQLVARRKPMAAKPAVSELRLIERLPFALTTLVTSLKEIREISCRAGVSFRRCGFGKTLVGWISALKRCRGGQVAFMAHRHWPVNTLAEAACWNRWGQASHRFGQTEKKLLHSNGDRPPSGGHTSSA